MSDRLLSVLAYLCTYQDAHGYAPSMREIATATGIGSTSTVSAYLDELEAQGEIARTPGVSRGIRVLAA